MKQVTGLLLSFFLTHAIADTISPHANWMSDIPNQRIMNQLIIPGSHDSGTYDIRSNSKFSLSSDNPLPIWAQAIMNILPKSFVQLIIANWSKTEPFTIEQQLNDGIRYLDLRVCLFQNTLFESHFYLCHTLLSDQLKNALAQIQIFAQNHPNEIILVDFNHIYNVNNSADETRLVELIQQYLGNHAISNSFQPNNTIGALRQSHHQLIIFMDINQSIADVNAQSFATHYFWSESAINSPWPNVSNVTDLKNTLDTEVAFRNKTYLSSNNFFVLQTIQTENTAEVINGILYPKLFAQNISQFELPVNINLTAWMNEYIAQYGQPIINIVMQDWYANHNGLVALAIQYDTQMINTPRQKINVVTQEKLTELKNWYDIHHE